jgi:AIG2 family protein
MLYLAYGSNMHRGQMAERCPGAVPAGTARLPSHRFRINSAGWATVTPEEGADVYGALWGLAEDDEHALDLYEGVAEGGYVRKVVEAWRWPSGGPVAAWLYVATDTSPGVPERKYLAGIVEAARLLGLPAPYADEVRAWGRPSRRRR